MLVPPVVLLTLGLIPTVCSWGSESHQAIAFIAGKSLTNAEASAIQELMGWRKDPARISDQLAQIANWADGEASTRGNWEEHKGYYRTGVAGNIVLLCGKGYRTECFWNSMKDWTSSLLNPASSRTAKRDSFKFIVHIVGDAFQPLHVGRKDDGGGSFICSRDSRWSQQRYPIHMRIFTILIERLYYLIRW